MKKLITFAILILSTPFALACPDLTGSYTCQNSEESYQAVIRTYEENGVIVYESNGEKMYADGQSRPVKTEEIEGTFSVTCAGNTVDVNLEGDILEQKSKVGTLKLFLQWTKNATGYGETTEGSATYKGQYFPVNESAICRKN